VQEHLGEDLPRPEVQGREEELLEPEVEALGGGGGWRVRVRAEEEEGEGDLEEDLPQAGGGGRRRICSGRRRREEGDRGRQRSGRTDSKLGKCRVVFLPLFTWSPNILHFGTEGVYTSHRL
jgi:hypothetical protein